MEQNTGYIIIDHKTQQISGMFIFMSIALNLKALKITNMLAINITFRLINEEVKNNR